MVNRNKAKGDQYERDILALALAAGFANAKRTRPGRREDEGDLFLNRHTIIQAKDVATPAWREWFSGLADQKIAAKARTAFLAVKRRGTGGRPALHLAVMPLDDMLELIKRAEGTE